MAIEQMNISLSPQMARFIRGKVKKGDYTNISEVVRDAIRRMQETELARKEGAWLASFEATLSEGERESVRRGVRHGIRDLEEGCYDEHDADGLRGLARTLVATSTRKLAARSKTG